jgi:hypothetical protein
MATATRARKSAATVEEDEAEKAGLDWPFRYEVLPLAKLRVDEEYQRPLTTFVKKIEANYDPAMVQTLIVSEREDGKWYAVIDGQTRMTAMRNRNLTHAPCVVYVGMNQGQEAALFAKFQTERRGMTSASRFRAQVIAKDLNASVIDALVKDCGYYIDQNDTHDDGRNIRAVGALEFVFWNCSGSRRPRADMSNANPELLKRTLRIIQSAWPPPHPNALSATMIRGIGQYLRDYGSRIEDDKLVARLKKLQPSELARRAEQLREGRGMEGNSPVYLAEALASEYGRRGK